MSTALVVATAFLWLLPGCGEPDSGTVASERSSASRAPAAKPVMGSFELPDTSFAFRAIKCNLTGTAPDGMFLVGSGTLPDGSKLLPDGRSLRLEVERLTPDMGGPGWHYERTTVQFGNFMDKDGWEATAASIDGSSWTSGDGVEKLDGPLIRVAGNDLAVEARFKHASRDERVEGTLRVTCPAATYP